jgi:phage gpG-like protein
MQKEIEMEIKASAQMIERNAVRDVPGDQGFLRNGITHFKSGNLQFDIVSNAEYSAYVEFGTGALVDVPEGLESYAIQFKGKGIKQVNLPARPFLFSNYHLEKPKLIQRIKNILADLK